MKKIVLATLLFTSLSFAQAVSLQSFATGFSGAVEIAHSANDSRLFVVQQGGVIKILNPNGSVNATPFLTLTSATILSGGERGLLGLAFHPNYATNGYFYVNYTRAGDGATVIARYSVSTTDANIADASSGTVLLTVDQPYSNHKGGSVKFGPDGYLYIGMGDGGSGGDPGDRAQNVNENLGKMLRIDVDSGSPYGIPPTNPYVGLPGNDEIWAIGMRNPWKFSFNRLNGDLWIADVGQGFIEEIDKIASPQPVGLNFGWRCYEGNAVYDTSSGTCPTYSATVPPVNQYTHTLSRCSITGGYYYTGSQWPAFTDKYFFADYCTGEIGWIDTAGALTWKYDATGSIVSFGEDKDGELYVSTGSTIYKVYDPTLGLNNFNKVGLSFYPNPTKTEIFIKNESGTALSGVAVFDLTGKLVLAKSGNVASLSVADLAKGLYLISLQDVTGNKFQSKLMVE